MKVIGKNVFSSFISSFVLVTCILAFSEDISRNEIISRTKRRYHYGRRIFQFHWFIENYSYSWHRKGDNLRSPLFSADLLEVSSWYLLLFPRGSIAAEKGHISLFLYRNATDEGPEYFPIEFELSILAVDGSVLKSAKSTRSFQRKDSWGYRVFAEINDILLRRKAEFLSQGTLHVRCKIWINDGSNQQMKQITARTRFGIQHISFLHIVNGFSSLQPNETKTMEIEKNLSGNFYLSGNLSSDTKIIVELKLSGNNRVLSRCKLCLVDGSEKLVDCGEADNRLDDDRKDIEKLPLSLTRLEILNRKIDLLPNDKLTLVWQGIFSTGEEYEKIESTVHQMPLGIENNIKEDDKLHTIEKLAAYPSALDDLKTIYNNGRLTDVQLKTKTKSFPAHKLVLSARSPIFDSMLIFNGNANSTSVIQVHDLEDNTVQQLLLFLYSDRLENLQWESAMKLYYAANKYEIDKLKVLCSLFLLKHLSVSKASELLLTADTHDDNDLKKAVEKFIFKNEEMVLGSEEWGKLNGTNPNLVRKIMSMIDLRKV